MGKLSAHDLMRIQTLCEQGLGYRKIVAAYPEKRWILASAKAICQRFHRTGSSVNRKLGSRRPKSARTQENIEKVAELICSQDDQPGTGKSTRKIASEVGICESSVRNIAKMDLDLHCYKRTPVQVLKPDTK